MLHRLPSNTLERNELFAILWSIRDPLMPPRRQLEDYCSTCHICDVLLSIVLVVSFSCTLLRRLVRCRGVSYAAAASRTLTFLCCGVSYAAAVSCTLLSLVRPSNNSLLKVPSGGIFYALSRPSALLQARHYSPQRHPPLYPWHFITTLYSCDACSVVSPFF